MKTIKIYSPDLTDSVTLNISRKTFTSGGEVISNKKQMADGSIVSDIVGFRRRMYGEWDVIPAADMVKIVTWIRQGVALKVDFPDVVEGDVSKMFYISVPTSGIYRFDGSGVPYWHGVKLTLDAQGVG